MAWVVRNVARSVVQEIQTLRKSCLRRRQLYFLKLLETGNRYCRREHLTILIGGTIQTLHKIKTLKQF